MVVLGCGPIGLLAAAAAKAEGARAVMITGTDRDEKLRLSTARKMGIEHVVNVEKENAVQKVTGLTNGVGADLVLEASGAEEATHPEPVASRTSRRTRSAPRGGSTVRRVQSVK